MASDQTLTMDQRRVVGVIGSSELVPQKFWMNLNTSHGKNKFWIFHQPHTICVKLNWEFAVTFIRLHVLYLIGEEENS